MTLISPDLENQLVAFVYDANYQERLKICRRIGLSYSTLVRNQHEDRPFAQVRLSVLERLIDLYRKRHGKVVEA